MRTSYTFLLTTALLTPVLAAEGNERLKQELENIGPVYAESFNRQDAAGIAAL
jgi:hypothetical protein